MERFQNIILITLIIVLITVGVFFTLGYSKSHKNIYLDVRTNKSATIFIDGENKGQSPQRFNLSKNSAHLKLVPFDSQLIPFEKDLIIDSNTTTSVNVNFSTDIDRGSYAINYFEKIDGNDTEVSVVSIPNLASVKLDGQARGFSPVKLSVTLGKHNIEVSFNGFIGQTFEISTKEGYRNISLVGLSKDPAVVISSPTPVPVEEIKENVQMVEIQDTPTGFLRVRSEANSGSQEMGQVKPGEKYKYLDKNEAGDWFKIEFEQKEGWVSNKYAKIIEE
jgi:uncharacterized protein YgiM (DUF1202 family)